MSKNITYTKAYEELQRIISEMEQGEISVDDLSIKVKRAAELIQICKKKLYDTESDINQILKELEVNPNTDQERTIS